MSITSYVIEHDGEYVGHAITLGQRVQFYTANRRLGPLNEARFESLEALQEAVTRALAPHKDANVVRQPMTAADLRVSPQMRLRR